MEDPLLTPPRLLPVLRCGSTATTRHDTHLICARKTKKTLTQPHARHYTPLHRTLARNEPSIADKRERFGAQAQRPCRSLCHGNGKKRRRRQAAHSIIPRHFFTFLYASLELRVRQALGKNTERKKNAIVSPRIISALSAAHQEFTVTRCLAEVALTKKTGHESNPVSTAATAAS